MDIYNIPVYKGWIPFKSILNDLDKKNQKINKEKAKEIFKNNEKTCKKLEVPKDWKTPSFKLEDNPIKRLYAATEFKVLFPSNLSSYLKESFPVAQKALEEHFIKAHLILNDGEMIVTTTRKTFDPVMIIRARGVIKLLARYVPVEEAIRVLEDGEDGNIVLEDIITISHHKNDTFLRRRSRFEDQTIKDLIKEILDCKIWVVGKTVAAIGSRSNLYKLREIVLDCFETNIHPIYNLKQLQMINKLKSMPEMAGKDWSEFIPTIPKKKNVKRLKPHKVRVTKEYSAFPPAPVERKIDKELEEGVFHLKYKKSDKKYFVPINKDTEKTKTKKNKDNNKEEIVTEKTAKNKNEDNNKEEKNTVKKTKIKKEERNKKEEIIEKKTTKRKNVDESSETNAKKRRKE